MNVFWILVYFSLHISGTIGGTVERMYIGNNQAAIKGSSIQLVCDISQFSSQDVVSLFKTDSRILTGSLPGTSLDQCDLSGCLTGSSGRYTYTADNSHVYIDITNLRRSEDQKYWTCVIESQRRDIYLTIYIERFILSLAVAVPQSLQFDSPPSQDQDLAENAVTFRCSTGCASPQPSFTWFYTETGGSRQEWSTSASVTNTAGGCTDSERIYTSTLSLARYTTFSGNVEKTVKFTCGITSFTGMTQPLYTNLSVNVQFAVRVTSVTLKDGNSEPSEPLPVTAGVSKTLTCTTSVSRPTATVIWYIGGVEKQRSSSSTSFTFTPQNSDHNKQVFCKAFNTQPESQAVSSNKATLDIQVQVTSVTLKDGNSIPSKPLQVTAGVSKTLTCTTSVTRPTATVLWYIGTVEKQRSSSSTSFTFTPQNSDHNKQVFCKAFNTQPESQAVTSNKAALYVLVLATTPTITNQTTGVRVMLENDTVSMECISSPTRPVSTVTWKKRSDRLTNVQNTNIPQTGDLVSVRSTVTFTPNRNDDNRLIYCETAIPGQQNKPVLQQRVTVYWPPSTPVIPVTDLPFLEGQIGKKLSCISAGYGNPPSEASWDKKYGTQDGSDSRILNLPRLTSQMNKSPVSCQLQNSFTQAKHLQVKSPTISVTVEYTPVVNILEDGKEIQTATKIEGQTFSATCSADGNPIPTVRWQGRNPASADLRFNDIERSDHGTYTCKAEATSTKYTSHNFVTLKNLNVVVNYPASIRSLYIEGHLGQRYVTVDEHHAEIQFKCMVDSKSAATIKIIFDGGVLTEQIHETSLSFVRHDIACVDAGLYICEGSNGYGRESRDNITLFVRCSPRPYRQIQRNITSDLHTPLTLSFTAIAYPEPGPKGFTWHKEDVVGWLPLLSNADLMVSSSELQSNLTLMNVSKEDFGHYRVTVTNDIGTYEQHWFLSENGQQHTDTANCIMECDNTALIVGVILGVVCVVQAVYATYITILHKRKTINKGTGYPNKPSKPATYVNQTFTTDVTEGQEYEGVQTGAEGTSDQQYTDLSRYANTDKDTYDVIKKI